MGGGRGYARRPSGAGVAVRHPDVRRPLPDPGPSSDPLISALARLVEVLDERYPDGAAEVIESDVAITADMPIVSDPERSPAA